MRRRAVLLFLAFGLLPGASRAAGGAAPPSPRHVVLISIDGLMPSTYTQADALGLKVPNLRRLAAGGAFASGVVGVLPSVTYPSHTTIITGVAPREHGIVANTYLDPAGISNDAWRWYAREIRVPTLVSAARAAGRLTGSVSWPVSVGLDADFLVAEISRTGSSHPSDLELLRALSTPGLLEAAEAARGAPIRAPLDDVARTDLALTILRTWRPGLLLLHLLEVDSVTHEHGPGTPEAHAAIERADVQLGRLLETLEKVGIADHTLVAVVSDHGFIPVERIARPNTLLVEAGLATLDEKGNARTWKAWFFAHGGSAALYLADPADQATRRRVRELVATKMTDATAGIRAVIDGERQAALGGDDAADLFLDAADGYSLSRTATGGWFGTPVDRGYHGYAPDRPAMHAALILSAPQLRRRGDLGVVPMTRIAATLAGYLGVEMPATAGPALPVLESRAPQ